MFKQIIGRLMGVSLVLLAAAFLPELSVPAEPADAKPHRALAPGEYSFSLRQGDVQRSYLVHMPPQAACGEALPLVLNFHGAGSNGKQQEGYSEMDATADRHGFIAVYPNGSGKFGNHFTWNAGFCCTYAMTHQVDDVGFVIALIDDLAARTPINRRRVYSTGISNGGMMSYRLAAQASGKIAAIAPVAGSMVLVDFTPEHPMPVMAFNSVDDPFVHYYGGYGKQVISLFRRNPGQPGVEKVVGKWREYDGCPEAPHVAPTLSGKPGTGNEGITATRYAWGPCKNATEVVLWKFTGAGHVWPGGIQDRFEHILGRSTDLVDANEEMWSFFSKFELPGQ
ncbi:MAG TPA: PHB depolymerase family esterase [Candidatus Binataceae bacterium]|nr:PHB depolymerase family esterase [Candidatus Binataceae bacterium]